MSNPEQGVKAPELDDAPVKDPLAVEINKAVKEKVNSYQDTNIIRARVISHFADQEVEKRVGLLTKSLQKRDEVWRDLQKIKPDLTEYNEDGEQVSANWSKDEFKKRKEVRKKLKNIDQAINRAFANSDYEGLKKIAN